MKDVLPSRAFGALETRDWNYGLKLRRIQERKMQDQSVLVTRDNNQRCTDENVLLVHF